MLISACHCCSERVTTRLPHDLEDGDQRLVSEAHGLQEFEHQVRVAEDLLGGLHHRDPGRRPGGVPPELLVCVGVGIPGTISPATGLVKNANSTWLIGHPFDKDLETVLGRPVRLANDANCFALSEAADGAAAGAASL